MNPFIDAWTDPVVTLTRLAYALFLVGMLVLTWWAAGRNYLWLEKRFQDGWKYLVPLWFALRTFAMLAIAAVDLLLIAGIIYVLT